MPTKTKSLKSTAAAERSPVKKNRPSVVKNKTLEVVSSPPPTAGAGASRNRNLNVVLCFLLAVATFAVYYRSTRNPFVNYDDWGYVTENQHVQQGLTRETLRWALTATAADNWHPLTWISHALDCQLFGLNASGHHLTSVLLHLLNSALIFLMLVRVTGARWRSLLVAALFALHPINVESVAWVAERKNVLSMFFFLLTLAAYGRYARRPGVGRYTAGLALFALGLAAKPMIVTLPCVLLLLDFWPLGRVELWSQPSVAFPVTQIAFRRLLAEKIPFLLLSVASSVVTVMAQRGAIRTSESYPILIRLANALYAYVMYIVKAFWPLRLGSFYPYEGLRLSAWQVLVCLFLLVGVTAWVWLNRSRQYLPVGWFWFLGTLVPVIGFVQVGDQAMADRYAYLPLVGIFVIIVWGLADWLGGEKQRLVWGTAAAAAVVVVLTLLTSRQIRFWNSSYDLWSHALQVTDNNYMAEDYVGTALLVKAYEKNGQRFSDEALAHFQNAVRINPKDAISHLNLGADFQEHGKLEEAIQEYKTVLTITQDPRLIVKVYIDLGAAFHQLGDLEQSQQCYRQALKLEPQNRIAFENLGKLGMDQRIRQLAAAAIAHPSAKAYFQLGQLQQATGRLPEARASYEAALSLDRGSADVRAALQNLDGNSSH
jgi:Flp pilus assembly protein TadD